MIGCTPWTLACSKYTLGNSLDLLFIRIGGVRSRRWPFCQAITTLIKTASKMSNEEKSPLNKLTYGMFRPGKSKQPCLKCKAAHARHMLPLILYMFENIYFQEDNVGEVHLQTLNHCNDMYNSLYAWKETGSTAARDSMVHHGRMFLILYEELYNLAFTMKKYSHMWKWKPTFHHVDHILAEVFDHNPALLWNYRDESAIGEAVKVAENCHLNTIHRLDMERRMI